MLLAAVESWKETADLVEPVKDSTETKFSICYWCCPCNCLIIFLHCRQPAKLKARFFKVFWKQLLGFGGAEHVAGLMKGQRSILWKTILAELTKEKKKENESDLSMHSWQMAKMYVCLKNKIKKESKEGGKGSRGSSKKVDWELPFVAMKQRELSSKWKDYCACISSSAVLSVFLWTAIYANSKSSISRSCVLPISVINSRPTGYSRWWLVR